jgi:hypothetical protein
MLLGAHLLTPPTQTAAHYEPLAPKLLPHTCSRPSVGTKWAAYNLDIVDENMKSFINSSKFKIIYPNSSIARRCFKSKI